ncbi:MAG: hypothetical protein K0U90_08440 [Planctomycetes bacterium]|nr:hypothetical protein [Planctomycetota bacterium]
MIKKANDKEAEQVFRMVIQPVNEFTTTEGMINKLKILFGSAGLRVVSAEPIEDDEA